MGEHEDYPISLMSMVRYDLRCKRMSMCHRDHPSQGVLR
jgi:hypothetical protein